MHVNSYLAMRCVRATRTDWHLSGETGKVNSLADDVAFALFSTFLASSLLSFIPFPYSTLFFHLLSSFSLVFCLALSVSLSRLLAAAVRTIQSAPMSFALLAGRTNTGLLIDLAGAGWATPETSSGTRFECQQQQLRSLHFCHKKIHGSIAVQFDSYSLWRYTAVFRS